MLTRRKEGTDPKYRWFIRRHLCMAPKGHTILPLPSPHSCLHRGGWQCHNISKYLMVPPLSLPLHQDFDIVNSWITGEKSYSEFGTTNWKIKKCNWFLLKQEADLCDPNAMCLSPSDFCRRSNFHVAVFHDYVRVRADSLHPWRKTRVENTPAQYHLVGANWAINTRDIMSECEPKPWHCYLV